MTNLAVTKSTDNGQGTVEGSLSWAIKQANETAGDDVIRLTTDVTLTGEMSQLIDSNITIEGGGSSADGDREFNIDGNSAHRPLFVKSGTVVINDTDIVGGLAKGENGGSGGAGLGGGLFIYSGDVTLSNLDFEQNKAWGGDGRVFFDEGNVSPSGGGFPPLFQGGQGGRKGSDGDVYSSGCYYDYSSCYFGIFDAYGGSSGGNGGFGSGGGTGGSGGNGFILDYGGTDSNGKSVSKAGPGGDGGLGGFGGGGGAGGYRGFYSNAYGDYSSAASDGKGGKGGFGGSDGQDAGYGGGGAGLGGGIFIRTGRLSLFDVAFIENSAEGGYGNGYGKGYGGALFAMHITENTNGNNLGMPDILPVVNITSAAFSGNTATDAASDSQVGVGTDLNNNAVFGTTVLVTGRNVIEGTQRRDILTGTNSDDEILGLGGNDAIDGGLGNDFVDGGSGNDRLLGDRGNDTLIGGNGNDFLLGGAGDDSLNGGQGRDRLLGGRGNDVLIGEGGNDFLKADAGNDRLDGGCGNDTLLGGNGNDTLIGFAGNDLLEGGNGSDRLDGGQGRDKLFGGGGNDELIGGTGNDFITGDGGNDRLVGGEGRDVLTGGGGRDLFVIGSGGRLPARDVITDFRFGQDKIELVGLSFGALSFQRNRISITETNEVIAALTGIDTTALTEADFV